MGRKCHFHCFFFSHFLVQKIIFKKMFTQKFSSQDGVTQFFEGEVERRFGGGVQRSVVRMSELRVVFWLGWDWFECKMSGI